MEVHSKKATKGGEQWTASSSSSSFSVIANLPIRFLMEILSRLPIKTLVASKCVCKSWLHLINDPYFAQMHRARAKVEVCFQSDHDDRWAKIYMSSFHFRNDSRSLDMKLNTLLELPQFIVTPDNVLKYDTRMFSNKISFVNSCNGLLCYCGEPRNFAVIWNPITSEFATFPATFPVRRVTKGVSNCTYGLGFSQKDNRFKLFRIVARKKHEVVAEICTIEKGCSWRMVESCPPASPAVHGFYLFGFFLKGALHWVDIDCLSSNLILTSFGFEHEKFGQVPLPPHFKSRNMKFTDRVFGVLAGCVSVNYLTDKSLNIWLMKEYGVQDSWTQLFSLQFNPVERNKYEGCVLINYVDNGEILMGRARSLVLCNPARKRIRAVGFSHQNLAIIKYIPSLVLLKDSMMGYEVHVKPRWPYEREVVDATPTWWKSVDYPTTRVLMPQKLQQKPLSRDQTSRPMDARLDGHAPAVACIHKESSTEKSHTKSERLCGEGSTVVPPLSITMMQQKYEKNLKEMREHFEKQLRDSQKNYEEKLRETQQKYEENLRETQVNYSKKLWEFQQIYEEKLHQSRQSFKDSPKPF